MLIKFKSKASGEVIMLGESGKEILKLLGKDANDNKGIFTADQLPDAIKTLKQAIALDKAVPDTSQMEKALDNGHDTVEDVRIYQRAVPVLELMERALQEDTYVTWGV